MIFDHHFVIQHPDNIIMIARHRAAIAHAFAKPALGCYVPGTFKVLDT